MDDLFEGGSVGLDEGGWVRVGFGSSMRELLFGCGREYDAIVVGVAAAGGGGGREECLSLSLGFH